MIAKPTPSVATPWTAHIAASAIWYAVVGQSSDLYALVDLRTTLGLFIVGSFLCYRPSTAQ